jgi:hypothetical protein
MSLVMGVSQATPVFHFPKEELSKILSQGSIRKPLIKTLRQQEEELQNYFFYTEICKD